VARRRPPLLHLRHETRTHPPPLHPDRRRPPRRISRPQGQDPGSARHARPGITNPGAPPPIRARPPGQQPDHPARRPVATSPPADDGPDLGLDRRSWHQGALGLRLPPPAQLPVLRPGRQGRAHPLRPARPSRSRQARRPRTADRPPVPPEPVHGRHHPGRPCLTLDTAPPAVTWAA
jgi:hypothetical protein